MIFHWKGIKVMALLKPKWLFEHDQFKVSTNYRVHVHTINLSDVDDPEIFLAQPIYEWQQTEKGKWIMEHSTPAPSYHYVVDVFNYGYQYKICAYFNEHDYIVYKLKYA